MLLEQPHTTPREEDMDWTNPTVYVIFALAILGGVFAAGQWVGRMNSLTKTISESINEIKNDIKEIFKRLPSPSVAGESPVQLTNFGKKISNLLEAKTWAKDLAPSLLSQVKGKAEFEIYEFCGRYVQDELAEEWEKKILSSAYELATDREAVLAVLRVELRDALLSLGP